MDQVRRIALLLTLLVCAFIYTSTKLRPVTLDLEMSDIIRFPALSHPSASIILLHGLGSSADTFPPLAKRFHKQKKFQHINFVFPNAPISPVSAWGDRPAHNWFNVYEFIDPNGGSEGKHNETEYWKSIQYVQDLIQKEVDGGIPLDRIIVGGFSQGGMLSLGAVATIEPKIGGFIIMSGVLPVMEQFDEKLVDTNKDTPLFHGHGDADTVFGMVVAERTVKKFKELGFNYDFHVYHGMTHSRRDDELGDIEAFVEKIVPQK